MTTLSNAYSVHPGLVLKDDVLPSLDLTGAALADAIKVARPGFNNMLNAKRALTPALAVKIEAAIGYPASLLLRLQTAFDLAEAQRSTDVKEVIRLAA